MALFVSTVPRGRRATGMDLPARHHMRWERQCISEHRSFVAGTLDPEISAPEVRYLRARLRFLLNRAETGQLRIRRPGEFDPEAEAAELTSSPYLYELRPRLEKRRLPAKRELRLYCGEPSSPDVIVMLHLATKPGRSLDAGEQQTAIREAESRATAWLMATLRGDLDR